MSAPDPRVNAHRPDLAAESLRGQVEAERFASPERRQVIRREVGLRGSPGAKGWVSQLVYGQVVDVYETVDGTAWVQGVHDGYVGYAEAAALGPEGPPPSHRVSRPFATLYPLADIKTVPRAALPLGALLSGTAEDGFLVTEAGAVPLLQVAPLDEPAPDFVTVAEMLLNAPYLWGGGTALGLDCSGLVQIAMMAAGRPCPRDSDMQAAELGAPIPPDAPLQRGDLIFWRGHAGIMRDDSEMLHANARHMAVTSEPLAGAAARIKAGEYGDITARRRPGRTI